MKYGGKDIPIGLVENKDNERFECGTCQFYSGERGEGKVGVCMNQNPKLHRRRIKDEWCCNLYHRPGMKTIVA